MFHASQSRNGLARIWIKNILILISFPYHYANISKILSLLCLMFNFHMEGSVWSSLPPINSSSKEQSKPIILTVASMDSASFFRDKSLGADSPISVSACGSTTVSLFVICSFMMFVCS